MRVPCTSDYIFKTIYINQWGSGPLLPRYSTNTGFLPHFDMDLNSRNSEYVVIKKNDEPSVIHKILTYLARLKLSFNNR